MPVDIPYFMGDETSPWWILSYQTRTFQDRDANSVVVVVVVVWGGGGGP